MSTTETATRGLTGTWTLDPVHSTVGFEIKYLTGTFRGQFRDVDAGLDAADDGVELSGSARVESVDVKDEMLAGHLLTPDFFDAERFPELTFRAEGLEPSADGTISGTGEITIKGVTRPVEFAGSITGPNADHYGRDRVGAILTATVDRTEFGVSWNAPLPTGEPALANDVTINAELFFIREG